MISSFWFIFLLTFVFSPLGRASSCLGFYSSDVEKRQFLAAEAKKARDYIKDQNLEKKIEGIVRQESQEHTDIIAPIKAEQYRVEIKRTGTGPNKPVQVILSETHKNEETGAEFETSDVLLTSLKEKSPEKGNPKVPTVVKYRNNNTVVPVGAMFSPNRDFLIVNVSTNGSIDNYTLVIFDVKTRKKMFEVNNVHDGDVVWTSPNQFVFNDYSQNYPQYKVTLKMGKISVDRWTNKDPNPEKGSDDQQWYSEKYNDEFTKFVNVKTKQQYYQPIVNVLDILKPEVPENDILWVRTKGRDGFREVVRLDLKTNTLKRIVIEDSFVIGDVKVFKDYVRYVKYLGKQVFYQFRDHNGKHLGAVETPSCCTLDDVKFNPETRILSALMSSPLKENVSVTFDFEKKTMAS